MTRESDSDPAVRLLADLLVTDLPPQLEGRMRAHLDSLHARMASPEVVSAGRTSRPLRRWAALATASAAALLLAFVLFPIGSPTALGQIVESVAAKTWLHARGTGPDGEPAEMWFSARKGIVAFRAGESCVFVDEIQGTMDLFGNPHGTDSVQRMPLKDLRAPGIEAARRSFLALLGGDVQQAMASGESEVLEHSEKAVRVAGRELIEHRFVVGRRGQSGTRSESLLQVDPETHLPLSWQMRHGDQQVFDFSVSYPEHGPLTISALGVPETTRIVDLEPASEFKQALLATTAARRRFDDYHAVVVESNQHGRATGWDVVHRIWRKGDRWRVDQCQPDFDLHEETPDAGDPATWWLRQARTMRSYPREIWDGRQLWVFEPEYATPGRPDPANPRFRLITSLKKTTRPGIDGTDPQSYLFMLNLPEFYGYEHLNRGASFGFRAETRPVELDQRPMLLVDILNVSSDSPRTISPDRYWLDPRRGHLMVRKEQFRVSQPDQPIGASEVVSSAQSPQGFWYPTTVRLIGNTVSLEDNRRSDSYVRYFLEFDGEIPDDLFNAELVDTTRVWTQSE